MHETPQQSYETRLRRFLHIIHGPEGLVAKLAVFRELLRQFKEHGEDLWSISPPLYFFARSMQNEVLLALARLLETKERSWGNLEKFLDFSAANAHHIRWADEAMTEEFVFEQKASLKLHSGVIAAIMGRRDKVIAHLDRKYFFNPDAVNADFPLGDQAMIDLANEIIRILGSHEQGLTPNNSTFHLGEFYHIAVDNMVRALEKGRIPIRSGGENGAN